VIKRVRVMSPAITSRSDMMRWFLLRDGGFLLSCSSVDIDTPVNLGLLH